ncbi:MAG: response regulator [Planctomycetota bacterium]
MQKVLIADNDPTTRAYYAQLVSSLGHLPLTCEDGIAALDCATANPDIDLILTDIDLPGAWGEQLIEVLRGIDRLASVPILVVSAPRTRTELMRLLVIGVRQWFQKPPEESELVTAIESCLDRSAALDLFDVEDKIPAGEVLGAGPSSEWLLAGTTLMAC